MKTKNLKNRLRNLGGRLTITTELFNRNQLANHAAAGAYGFLLSALPAILLGTLIVTWVFRAKPEKMGELFSVLGNLGGLVDSQDLLKSYLSFSFSGIAGIVATINLIWTTRVFALSLQRGLRVIFAVSVPPNPIKEAAIPFVIEFFALFYALILWGLLQIPSNGAIPLWLLRGLFPLAGLGFLSYLAYRFVPIQAPSRRASLVGALFCVIAFGLLSTGFHLFVNPEKYDRLYGSLGNLILLLANVYFFFMFFFMGAQFTFVWDSIDALTFSRFHRVHRNTTETSKPTQRVSPLERRFFSSTDGALQKYLHLFNDGDMLFRQGDGQGDVYYIIEGSVGIYLQEEIQNGPGKEYRVGQIGGGNFLGEMGYLLGEARTATAKVEGSALVLALPPRVFEEILETDPQTARGVINSLSERLKNTNKKIEDGAV
jgi:membrane protein